VAVLRGIGVCLAVALGAVAVWLIVTSTSQKRIEIGVLAGLWGFLIGAYAAFGSRQQVPAGASMPTMPIFDPDAPQSGGGVLDVRPRSDLQRKEDIAARREFQARLEKVLRREVQDGLARELSGLRAEVAALRSELVEKVGGQLRLERIETTRLIGSDLEALQQQVRELKFLQEGDSDETETSVTTVRRSIEGVRLAKPPPVRQAAPAPAEVLDVVVVDEPEPEPAAQTEAEQPVAPGSAVGTPSVAAGSEPAGPPAPQAATDDDPFAAMPRLSPFTDFEPITDPPAAIDAGATTARGGRRHREDDSEDNVLARILQRERTSSQ
jgi:hypothetical protein